MKLQENIKSFRKELGMTQEQLAEATGVTVGAVSKWESGATTPDLSLLIAMAELFQTSVDALLGFRLEGAGAAEQVKAIRECYGAREFEKGRVKAEKALQNFPNHFEVVYHSAVFFELLAINGRVEEAAGRAIELYRRAVGSWIRTTTGRSAPGPSRWESVSAISIWRSTSRPWIPSGTATRTESTTT